MILPKHFLLTARKILILPKSSKLGGAIAIPAPPAGTAMTVIQVNRDIYTLRGYRAGILLRYYRNGMQRAVLPPLPPLAKGQGGQLPPLPPLFRHPCLYHCELNQLPVIFQAGDNTTRPHKPDNNSTCSGYWFIYNSGHI